MATVVVVFSGNGGSGKSLVSCNLACGLISFGKKVLLTEVSFGQRADDIILGITSDTVYGFSDICSGSCKSTDAIIRPENKLLPDFIASVPGNASDCVSCGLESVIKTQSGFYDYIILDLCYSFGTVFDASVRFADIAVGVTDDSVISVRNTSLCMTRARELECKVLYTIINRTIIDNSEPAVFAEDIADELGSEIIGIIPYDEYINVSYLNSDPIIRYNTFAGRSLENICRRITGISVPKYETGLSSGFFSKNKLVLK